MIKKIVLKGSKEVIKEHKHEFNDKNLYVSRSITGLPILLTKVKEGFIWVYLDGTLCYSLTPNTFDLAMAIMGIEPVYPLRSIEELVEFLKGKPFPQIVGPWQETRCELADSEILLDDVIFPKPIAFFKDGETALLKECVKGSGLFDFQPAGNYKHFGQPAHFKKTIKKWILDKTIDGVYQFDTEKEYHKWAIERISKEKIDGRS